MLTVAALVMVSVLPGKQAGDYNRKVLDTLNKIQKIEEATKSFMARYGRRPCPADGQYAQNTTYFGLEAANPGTCTGGTPAAPLGPDGATSNVVAGVVPTKTLNLPDDYAIDAWGRRFTYFVDARATSQAGCTTLMGTPPHSGVGSIKIKDSSGSAKDYVMVAYISHGPDGHGAWPQQGSTLAARLNAGSHDPSTLDNASVNNDFTVNFDNVLVQKERTAGFDDIVYYPAPTKDNCCVGAVCAAHAVKQTGIDIYGQSGDLSGWALATGDVNGDGIPDLIIGSSHKNGGVVYVVFGTRDGFPDPLPLASLDGTNGFTISNSAIGTSGEMFGWSVAAGDINGDSVADIIIGAPLSAQDLYTTCVDSSAHGRVYVVFGHHGYWPAQYILPGSGSNYDESKGEGFVIKGPDTGGGVYTPGDLGWAVAAGDTNGDGIADVVAGSLNGPVAVVRGHHGSWKNFQSGLSDMALINDGTGQTSGCTNSNQHLNNTYFGYSVAAGYVSSHTSEDIIIGAPMAATFAAGGGGAYVLDGTGVSPGNSYCVTDLGNTGGMVRFAIADSVATEHAGVAVAAGDINGDGYDDVIVGAPGSVNMLDIGLGEGFGTTSSSLPGSAYVVFGDSGSNTTVRVESLDGDFSGFRVQGANANNNFGNSVTAGDINGDKIPDLIVGAPVATMQSITHSGAAYAIFGHGGKWTSSFNVSVLDGTSGTRFDAFTSALNYGEGADYAAAYMGWAVVVGDINGDGYGDLVIGSPDSQIPANDAGIKSILFGTDTWGADTDVSGL